MPHIVADDVAVHFRVGFYALYAVARSARRGVQTVNHALCPPPVCRIYFFIYSFHVICKYTKQTYRYCDDRFSSLRWVGYIVCQYRVYKRRLPTYKMQWTNITQIPLGSSRHVTTRYLAHAFWHREKS